MNGNGFRAALIMFSILSAWRAFSEYHSPESGFRFLIIIGLAILEMIA